MRTNSWSTPYKFNSKELDEETGLFYYHARYYDPGLSVWMSVDPLAEKYPNVSSYVYCVNNPVNYIDPDGRVPMKSAEKNAILKSYSLAFERYSKSMGKANLYNTFPPPLSTSNFEAYTHVPVSSNLIRSYPGSSIGQNELTSPLSVTINDKTYDGYIGFIIAKDEKFNIIGKVSFDGLIKSKFLGRAYFVNFFTSGNREIGTIAFDNSESGEKAYLELKKIFNLLKNAETYREALRSDNENNIDHSSNKSKVYRLNQKSTIYREAFNTVVSIDVKNGSLIINTQKKNEPN